MGIVEAITLSEWLVWLVGQRRNVLPIASQANRISIYLWMSNICAEAPVSLFPVAEDPLAGHKVIL